MESALICIDWTPDYMDGLVVVAMLQSEGVEAFLPDDNFVRQDWFQNLAYGGFRIMVPTSSKEKALSILHDYRCEEMALDNSQTVATSCPYCSEPSTQNDLRPRRIAFVILLLATQLGSVYVLAGGDALPEPVAEFLAWGLMVLSSLAWLGMLVMLFPCVLRRWLFRRYSCKACGLGWREHVAAPFAELQRSAQT